MAQTQLGPKIATIYELQSALLEPKLKEEGFTWATFELLTSIRGLGDEASQIEVAKAIEVTPSTLSESVQFHIRKGLVEQIPSSVDRRVKVLRLTPTAQIKLKKIGADAAKIEQMLSEGFTQKEAESCAKTLDSIIKKLERAVERAQP